MARNVAAHSVATAKAAAVPRFAQAPIASVAGLRVGAQAPSFSFPALDADRTTLDAFRARGKPVMLIFWDPSCGPPCRALLREISRWKREYTASMTVALVSQGSREDNNAHFAGDSASSVVLQLGKEVALAYLVAGIPSAVIVRSNGVIGSRLALGADSVKALVNAEMGRY